MSASPFTSDRRRIRLTSLGPNGVDWLIGRPGRTEEGTGGDESGDGVSPTDERTAGEGRRRP